MPSRSVIIFPLLRVVIPSTTKMNLRRLRGQGHKIVPAVYTGPGAVGPVPDGNEFRQALEREESEA